MGTKRQALTKRMVMVILLSFGITLQSEPALAKKQCEWYIEQTFVMASEMTPEEKKTIEKLLAALVDAAADIADEVSAVRKAIKNVGIGKTDPTVYIIYACEDDEHKIHRMKQSVTNTYPW